MKHYLDLVSVSANIRRRQSRMIRVCITLSVFLTAVMYGLADMFLQGTVKGQTPGSGAYQIYQAAFILALIVMLTSALMISSGLNSNVAQRTRFFGMLRCLGATRRQIKRFVRYESLYLCKTAVPAGIILSVVVVWILSAAMRAAILYWFASMPVLGISWITVMPEAWTPDLSIVSEDNTCSIPQNLLGEVCQNDAVKHAYGRMFAYDVPVMSGSSTCHTNLISYEEHQFHWAAASLEEGSVSPVMQEENQVLFVRSDRIPVHAGDQITLTIGGRMFVLTVAGVLSDSPLAREKGTGTIFCSEDTFTALTGETGYTILDVQFRASAAESDIAEVEHIFTDCNVSFHDQFAPMKQQYGIMRAIGMSKQQLVKNILAEAAVYAVSGTILGCLSGIPLHWVVFTSLITSFWGKAWTIPLLPLGIISGIIFLTTVLAVRGPAKQLCSMTVTQSIGQFE